jgi:hypothetical protein
MRKPVFSAFAASCEFAEQNVTPAVDRRELTQRFGREGAEYEEEDLVGEVVEATVVEGKVVKATGREAGGGGESVRHDKEYVLSHANRAKFQSTPESFHAVSVGPRFSFAVESVWPNNSSASNFKVIAVKHAEKLIFAY